MNQYAQRVRFAENQDLIFPDFTLRYTGQTRQATAQYPPGFTFYNFTVKTDKTAQTVRWSSGTGDIGPQPFAIDGKGFQLELRISDTLGNLAPDELVITTQALRPAIG